MNSVTFAVLGAGNGGQTFAAHLAMLGYEVTLFDVDAERVESLKRRGHITLEGALSGKGLLRLITADIGAAVREADVVMIVVPACFHENLVEQLAPHLHPGQIVVLNPGATGGALAARQILSTHATGEEVLTAETGTLLYACRAKEIGHVQVFAVKDEIDVAVLPANATMHVHEILREPFPAVRAAPSVLHTSFGNLNALVHPAPTLLNLGRIEGGIKFQYYREGMTPSISRIVERMDAERLAVAKAYGVETISLRQALRVFYGVGGKNLFETFRSSLAHEGVMAPESADTRYIFEDVPTGLVPLIELGGAAKVPTPTLRAVADLGCALAERNFWSEGRTLSKLGLAGKTLSEIRRSAS